RSARRPKYKPKSLPPQARQLPKNAQRRPVTSQLQRAVRLAVGPGFQNIQNITGSDGSPMTRSRSVVRCVQSTTLRKTGYHQALRTSAQTVPGAVLTVAPARPTRVVDPSRSEIRPSPPGRPPGRIPRVARESLRFRRYNK